MFFQSEEFVFLRESSEELTQKWAGVMIDHLIHSQTHTDSACIRMPRFLQVRFGSLRDDISKPIQVGWVEMTSLSQTVIVMLHNCPSAPALQLEIEKYYCCEKWIALEFLRWMKGLCKLYSSH